MNVTAAGTENFQLPALTYVNTSMEEAALRSAEGRRRKGVLCRMVSAARGWFEKQWTFSELMRMSDRELADIGLSRSDIHRVYDNSFNAGPAGCPR